MLRRLRIKFVVINMAIVTIMLGFIFGMLYYATSSSIERESLRMMVTIATNPMQIAPPAEERQAIALPYFSVMINHAGEASVLGEGYFDLSDEALLQDILDRTYAVHTESGVLEEYKLRFLCVDTPNGQCIVFSDISSERSVLSHLTRTVLLIGSAAFIAFFIISLLLARWAVKPVEKAWQQQKQFVADASHELKTPLTVIMTDAELLSTADCPETERHQLSEGILSMSRQMRGLVERMLELARIDSGTVKTEIEPVEVSELWTCCAMEFEPLFFEKALPFSYEIPQNIRVRGDRAKLKQLPEILLDNAAKYAVPGGNVTMRLKRLSKRKCCLLVENEGQPIEPGELTKLFERFYRADRVRSMDHSYGLGLSIAKEIVTGCQGSIRAESEDGVNRFIVELPTV